MKRVASYDVFDTLVMRRVVSPRTLFRFLGRSLERTGAWSESAEEFVRARERAELAAFERAQASGGEVRLAEIYAASELSDDGRARAQALEEELEQRLLVPVAGALERVRAQRANGMRIAFVSDTPHSAGLIESVLTSHGFFQPRDLLLVSSECQSNKANGTIYRELARRAEVRPDEIVHFGNHREHDVASAAREGLEARAVLEAEPNRYELLLDGAASSTGGLAGALAGAARIARQEVSTPATRYAAVRRVAASVVGPLLSAYVIWVLNQAKEHRVTTLWFLGRDGQVLYDLAKSLAPKLGSKTQLRYLHASRQAWNLPAHACGAHPELDWIWDRTDDLSIKKLLARVGLSAAEVGSELHGAGFPDASWSKPLDSAALERMKRVMQLETIRARVRTIASDKSKLVQRYLEQVGVLEDPRPALVELTGHGNLQESLTALLRDARDGEDPIGLYFALMADDRTRDMPAPQAWLYDERTHEGVEGVVPGWGVVAVEAFCAADHGTLTGYRDAGGRVETVLKEARNGPVVDWGLPIVRRALERFADALVLERDLVEVDADARAAVVETLREFWLRPTHAEADAWGAFPWEDGFGEETRYLVLARARSWDAARRALRAGRIPKTHRAAWDEAEEVLTPPLMNWSIEWGARASRLTRRIARRVVTISTRKPASD